MAWPEPDRLPESEALPFDDEELEALTGDIPGSPGEAEQPGEGSSGGWLPER